MNNFLEKALTMFLEDPEAVVAAASGSISESVLHPRVWKRLLPHIIRAGIIGFFLAEFISPVISEKFDLTRRESIALSFVFGFAGVKVLTASEKIVMKKLQLIGGTEGISTLSSKPSEEAEGESEGSA